MKVRRAVEVNDLMQQGYVYLLSEQVGKNFHPDFRPELTPQEMLGLGVFGGKYMTDCRAEFPSAWFASAKLSTAKHDPTLNYFGVNASQPLAVWQAKGWIYHETRGAGSSGIAVIIWGGGRATMSGRCGGGEPSGGTSRRSSKTAAAAT